MKANSEVKNQTDGFSATECNYLVVLINSQVCWGIAEDWSITSVTYD